MSTPSIKVGQGNWGIKAGNLLGYANTEKKFSPVEFTSTRALNTATRVNASGNIEIVNANIPRIDYFGGRASLLVEPSVTNLAFNSADFTVSGTWVSGANTISANVTATLDPAGTNTADKIIPTAVSTTHFISNAQSIAFTSGTTYTVSVFSKAGGYDFLRIAFSTEVMPSSNRGASFNLTSGTVGDTQSGVTARIENYGNGWYRCSISRAATVSITPSNPFFINSQNSDSATSVTFTGDGTSGAFLYGAQLETGSVATSYIPTTTAAVPRNADVVSVSGAVSGSIGQTEGTIYLDLTVLGKGSSSATRWVQIFGPSNNIGLGINSSNLFRSIVNTQSDTLLTAPLTSGVKVAWAYDATGTTCFINGTQYTLTTGGNQTMSSLTSIIIDGSANIFLGFARIRAVSIYQTRLPNTTTDGSPSLQSITTL